MSGDKPIAKAPLCLLRKYRSGYHLALYVLTFMIVSGICCFIFFTLNSSSVKEVGQNFVYCIGFACFGLFLIIWTGNSRIVVYSDYLYLPTWYPSVLFRPNRRSKLEYSKIENVTVYRYARPKAVMAPETVIACIKLRNNVKVRKKPQILSTEHWKEGVVSKDGYVVIEKGEAGEKAFEKFLNIIKNRGITITTVNMSYLKENEADAHISKLFKKVTVTHNPVWIE